MTDQYISNWSRQMVWVQAVPSASYLFQEKTMQRRQFQRRGVSVMEQEHSQMGRGEPRAHICGLVSGTFRMSLPQGLCVQSLR